MGKSNGAQTPPTLYVILLIIESLKGTPVSETSWTCSERTTPVPYFVKTSSIPRKHIPLRTSSHRRCERFFPKMIEFDICQVPEHLPRQVRLAFSGDVALDVTSSTPRFAHVVPWSFAAGSLGGRPLSPPSKVFRRTQWCRAKKAADTQTGEILGEAQTGNF